MFFQCQTNDNAQNSQPLHVHINVEALCWDTCIENIDDQLAINVLL